METPLPPSPETTSPDLASMSLTDRLTDIFFSPGAVFDDIKIGPRKLINWLLPLILAIVVGATCGVVIFSQPAVTQQIQQMQAQTLQKAVKQGKMTEQQAAQRQQASEQLGPKFYTILAIVGSIFVNPIKLFSIALCAWLLGRFALHSSMSYMQAVEVTGLATIISIVGTMVGTILIASFGDTMATANPALLIDHRDALNKVHMTLSKFDVFDLWFIGLVAYGVARVSGGQWIKPAIGLYAIWAAINVGPVWIF